MSFFRMSTCHAQWKEGGHPRFFLGNNVAIFERDLRRWIATLATSRWTPIEILEKGVQQKTICFPLAKIQVKKQGET